MYVINLNVKANGTLETGKPGRLKLGTNDEARRVGIQFEVDESVEGTYQYIKLVNENLSYLFRVTSKRIILSKSITAKEGIWLMSFISTDQPISNNELTGNYVYISEPIECVVVRGIFNMGSPSAEFDFLSTLMKMNFTKLVIPEGIEVIGDYFLYNSKLEFDLEIGPDVISIGGYTFYDAVINSLTFHKNTRIKTLKDYAFYNVTFNDDIIIPKSLSEWGKHAFQYSKVSRALRFEEGSQLKTLGSYALWQTEFEDIELPDGLETLSGNTYVINNNTSLYRLWIPNTITTVIPANAIYGNSRLTEIVLEQDFNISANFSNCYNLSHDALVNMLYALKNLNGSASKTLTIGSTNLAKLNDVEKAIATNKNWTLS